MTGRTGLANHQAKHGLYADPSKALTIPGGRKASALPVRFHDDLLAAADDPNLSSLYDEMLIVDARISDLQKRIDKGESGALWMKLQQTIEEWARSSTPEEAAAKIDEMFALIRRGSSDHQQWLDIHFAIDQKMRIIRAETQRAKDIELLVRKDRVLLFIRAVVETVMRNVPDPEIQEIIRREIAKLINLPDYDFDRGF